MLAAALLICYSMCVDACYSFSHYLMPINQLVLTLQAGSSRRRRQRRRLRTKPCHCWSNGGRAPHQPFVHVCQLFDQCHYVALLRLPELLLLLLLLLISCPSLAHLLPIPCPSLAHPLPISCPSLAHLLPISSPSLAHLVGEGCRLAWR